MSVSKLLNTSTIHSSELKKRIEKQMQSVQMDPDVSSEPEDITSFPFLGARR